MLLPLLPLLLLLGERRRSRTSVGAPGGREETEGGEEGTTWFGLDQDGKSAQVGSELLFS